MKKFIALLLVLTLLVIMINGCTEGNATSAVGGDAVEIVLPQPAEDSDTSIEEALLGRRSIRDYSGEAITLEQLSQLLWAAQGITNPSGWRTAPSAGGLYPLKVYVVIGNVEGVDAGIYEYEPGKHALKKIKDGDQRQSLMQAGLNQEWIGQGAIDIVITAVYEITTSKYGDRGVMYVHMEAGHATQNICLQAVGLKLGTVTVGAFENEKVQDVLGVPDDVVPLYIMPVGNLID
jgi:SagB-type dehydrogenase family enzyme